MIFSLVIGNERRSRSSSVGTRRNTRKGNPSVAQKKSSSSNGNKPFPQVTWADRQRCDVAYSEDGNIDEKKTKGLIIMRSFPPDLYRCARALGGPVHGIWTLTHPLQVHPISHYEAKLQIHESSLSDHKRVEWELDLLREYDEKRIDRLENFLVGKRDSNIEIQLKTSGSTKKHLNTSSAGVVKKDERFYKSEYYKDRGRQPCRL